MKYPSGSLYSCQLICLSTGSVWSEVESAKLISSSILTREITNIGNLFVMSLYMVLMSI